jgi:hypothetical protein
MFRDHEGHHEANRAVPASTDVVGLARPAAAAGPFPFSGQGVEEVTSAVAVTGGTHVTTTGSGEATYLGQFSREAMVLIHPDGIFEGTVVFTAANGNMLVANIKGVETSPTTLAGTYTFSGGTGLFSDATGAADFTGVTSDGTHITLTFKGTIEY